MYYLTDFIDYEDMLTTLVKSVMIRKYYDYKVYFHNFSKFDGVFLLKILVGLMSFIEMVILFMTKKVFFYDSLLLLPSSLIG